MYASLVSFLERFISRSTLFKYGFNLSPMYSRSTGRVRFVSEDLQIVDIEIPLTWRNVNYVGTMFGGAMLSATDPILMIQLVHVLGDDYVVWDKDVSFRFRRPGRSTLRSRFEFSDEEVEALKQAVARDGETLIDKPIVLTDRDGDVVAEGSKTLFVASKEHYRAKRRRRERDSSASEAA